MTARAHSFGLGALFGLLLPSLVVAALGLGGDLDLYLMDATAYTLLPWMVPLGLVSFWIAWRFSDQDPVRSRGGTFSLGFLAGGTLAGLFLLFVATGGRPLLNRILFSVFGAPLLVGFWLWVGALLGHAAWQQRHKSGTATQS